MEMVNSEWRPSKKSSNALISKGYSQDQLNRIGKIFIQRYFNKLVDSPSSEFTIMVKKSEAGHNVAPPTNNANNALQQRKDDLANKSKEGHKKAQEAKNSTATDEMKLSCANMIHARYGTGFEECKKIVELITI